MASMNRTRATLVWFSAAMNPADAVAMQSATARAGPNRARFTARPTASGPASGTLVLNADGSFSYTPDADFNGADAFTYTVDDGNGGVTVGTVSISFWSR